ncbi:diguanylate cyclase [Mycetocola manganoxydans]|uniref:Diguanylate cyclase n=1 Tax=Mycetocola manganoxydans TaxID=699879 RepID=A0A3L6ZZS7_9MICO|nr:diguanylate cyclase [Mycetocola manganoxydans]RLP73459.1 diguanylate cyclase [Mycetocola manganoxydans]GHD41618.1 hypothetical protein GCM10008097_06540 [Mycetocola manganoxydans]
MITAVEETSSTLDLQTLLLASGMIVAICGVSFIINTVFGRNDSPGRLWSAAFVAGILATVSFAIWGAEPAAWWAVAVGNASLVLSMGFVWAGARVFNGRRSLFPVVAGGAGVAALAALVAGPDGGDWAGGLVFLVGVSAFASLAGVEAFLARMRRSVNARILAFVMLLVGAYYGTRAVAFVVVGPESDLFRQYYGTEVTTFCTILFVIVASTSMSILRAERPGPAVPRVIEQAHWNGILADTQFSTPAADRIRRANRRGEGVAFVGAEIDNLADMNTAFGRSFGDDAIDSFSSILQEHLPTTALIGRRAGAQFACVMMVDSLDEAYGRIEDVRAALVDSPIESSSGLRLGVSWGVVLVPPREPDIASLTAQVRELVASAQAAGGNRIAVDPAATR